MVVNGCRLITAVVFDHTQTAWTFEGGFHFNVEL